MESAVFKVRQACRYACVGRDEMYRLLNSGEIKAFRRGRDWRIPRESLDAWIRKQSGGPMTRDERLNELIRVGLPADLIARTLVAEGYQWINPAEVQDEVEKRKRVLPFRGA